MEERFRYLPNFDDALKGTNPKKPQVAKSLSDLLPVCSKLEGQSFRQQKYNEYQSAETAVEHLRHQKGESEARLAASTAACDALPDGAWLAGTTFLIAFAACFGAEFVLNWAVIPWLLSVPQNSLLGIALGIAPATAPVILDRILARVLGVCDAVDVLASSVSARIRSMTRTAFLVAAGATTLFSIWVLADARAAAAAIITNPVSLGPSPAQQHVLDLSLLLVSLVLTVNGALFYLFGAHEVKLALAKGKARAEVGRDRGSLAETAEVLVKAAPALAAARHAWDRIDELEKTVVESFVAEGNVKMAAAMSQPDPALSASERVRQLLGDIPFGAVAA